MCQFTFKNYKSFRGKATLDMRATAISEHIETILLDDDGERFLPLAVIYGPNGGGKSTVLDAFAFLIKFVLRPIYLLRENCTESLKGEDQTVPFKFNENSRDASTEFELFFRTKTAKYRYNLHLKKNAVFYESLYQQNKNGQREVQIFVRERDKKSVIVGRALKSLSKTDVAETIPFLSYAKILTKTPVIDEVIKWFTDCEIIDYCDPLSNLTIAVFKDKKNKEVLLGMLQEMDIDIFNFRCVKNDDGSLEIFTGHQVGDRDFELNLDEESSGTKKLIGFLPLVIRVLRNGGVMVIDGMDSKLHPKLIRYIIELFRNPKSNPQQAQLIFTSHDLSTMKNEVFRRDEIWFAAKDREQNSKLYSLMEIKDEDGKSIRKDAIFGKQYLEGRYGADPCLWQCLDWGEGLFDLERSSLYMDNQFIAHVRKNDDGTWAEPHLLMKHLHDTAKLAERFASKFQSGPWGKAAGLAHDAGKARLVWQKYLRLKSGFDEEAHLEGKPGKMPHAIYGAKLVEELFGKAAGRILAYGIAGHHAGLPDWSNAEGAGQASLQFQESQVKDLNDVASFVSDELKSAKPLAPPWRFADGLDMSLWVRMLYSCLVDADFLDTEKYMELDKHNLRGDYCKIEELLERFNLRMAELNRKAADTTVNQIRNKVRSRCVAMAGETQGIFSLSVPTGGGKTLSSLAFALEHARKHALDRIIYVIPYTSIIEQNAEVFRWAVGEEQVVEHHSSLAEDDTTPQSRLAAENWDAPVIVTTSVQFFESLFAARSSRCRKLHNIARSVVVLDEAQLMPVEYLAPILETMQLLADHYQVSFVISTATQPAFAERMVDGKLFKGLRDVKEIMGDQAQVRELYDSLKRSHVELPEDIQAVSSWEEIARELKQHEQVLCIVSDRKSCRELHSLMPEGTFHLSALMCGQHRSEKINTIKEKLTKKEPVRVISTQLVEAGVDFDFPVVYRALAGLDSIAQAAGRCNREGNLAEGKVVVFNAPKKAPMGVLRKAADTARGILGEHPPEPLDYDLFEPYFSELYWKANSLDAKNIGALLKADHQECAIYFRTAGERFRMIDDSFRETILVRYGEGEELIDFLKAKGPERWLLRKLQRYTVNIPKSDFDRMLARGSIEPVQPGIFTLTSSMEYSKDTGLLIDETVCDPEQYIYP